MNISRLVNAGLPVIFLCGVAFFISCIARPKNRVDQQLKYLALGDSYTIGQGIDEDENFPSQVSRLLKDSGLSFINATTIARTGWTTADLLRAIEEEQPAYNFSLVTLLIGVNNQYQGRSVAEYKVQFEKLLTLAIGFAGKNPKRVVVLSIPDYGATGFASHLNKDQISSEIQSFNVAQREISSSYNVEFINITPSSVSAATNASSMAADGLHYSGKEYRRWAESVVAYYKTTHH